MSPGVRGQHLDSWIHSALKFGLQGLKARGEARRKIRHVLEIRVQWVYIPSLLFQQPPSICSHVGKGDALVFTECLLHTNIPLPAVRQLKVRRKRKHFL